MEDILTIILKYSSFEDKLRWLSCAIKLKKQIICLIRTIPQKYSRFLNDRIISNYPYLHTLDAFDNPNITDAGIKGMPLHTLNASWNPNITDAGIKGMHLHTLNAFSNPNILSCNILYFAATKIVKYLVHLYKYNLKSACRF